MTALIVGTLFFLSINAIAWGVFYLIEHAYDIRDSRSVARYRHPSNRRQYPTSNVRVIQ